VLAQSVTYSIAMMATNIADKEIMNKKPLNFVLFAL